MITRRQFIAGSATALVSAVLPHELGASSRVNAAAPVKPTDAELDSWVQEVLQNVAIGLDLPYSRLSDEYKNLQRQRINQKKVLPG